MSIEQSTTRKLNWGCGGYPEPGWINSDKGDYPGVELVADIRDGLPLDTDSIGYAVSMHALPEVPYPDLVPAMQELRRVLEPGGVLRLALPDIDKGIKAYLDGDRDYFLIPDEDARSLGSKFILQMIWYGYSRTLFNYEFTAELLQRAGFTTFHECDYKETKSPFPDIVDLDNRERESFFVEAVK